MERGRDRQVKLIEASMSSIKESPPKGLLARLFPEGTPALLAEQSRKGADDEIRTSTPRSAVESARPPSPPQETGVQVSYHLEFWDDSVTGRETPKELLESDRQQMLQAQNELAQCKRQHEAERTSLRAQVARLSTGT